MTMDLEGAARSVANRGVYMVSKDGRPTSVECRACKAQWHFHRNDRRVEAVLVKAFVDEHRSCDRPDGGAA